MNLGKQIHTLLKRQDAVFVPKLGSFKRIYTSASFDEKRGVYLPPLTYIEFEKDSKQGYDFVQYLQQINQLNRQEAEQWLEDAIDKLGEDLLKSGQASLDGLGYLVSFGNSYIFKPLDLQGFNFKPVEDIFVPKSAIPLDQSEVVEDRSTIDPITTPVITLPESVEQERIAEVESFVEQPVEQPSVTPITGLSEDEKIRLRNYTELSYDDDDKKRSKTGLYVFLVFLVGLIGGGAYYYVKYIQPNNNLYQDLDSYYIDSMITPVDSLQRDSTLLDSTLLSHADSLTAIEKDSVQTDPFAVVDETPKATGEIKKYTIVIGTHKTTEQANQQVEKYKKEGHKSVHVANPNVVKNLKKVVWDTYSTKEQRDSALRYVHKNILADAWPDYLK